MRLHDVDLSDPDAFYAVTRLPEIQPAGEVRRLRSNFIDGIQEMPVRFTPEAN